jgi:hypothetical protein
MSHPIEMPQRVQLLDSSGQVTGSFVPENVLQELFAERNRLQEEVKRLQQVLQQAESDRDRLQRSFEFIVADYEPLLKKELEETEKNGITLLEVINQMEQDVNPTGP